MRRTRMGIVAATIGALLAADAQALAQSRDDTRHPAPAVRPVRPRIHIPAGRQFYRECVDGYREVWRPYWHETVIMPFMECHWVSG